MQLVKRYLHAVKSWLPEKQHADFLPELEDDLSSQIDEQERASGRKLEEKEISGILKKRGHPMVVATRLMPQQQLIGPAWFPVWRFALRAIILWILTPLFILILAPLAALSSPNPFNAFVEAVLRLPLAALYAAAAITALVALLERYQIKVNPFESWDPHDLPEAPADENTEWISRFGSVVEMAAEMMFLLWWIGIIKGPVVTEIEVRLGPVWQSMFWPILLIVASSVMFTTIKLISPYWRRSYSIANLVLQFATLALLTILLNADPMIVVTSPAAPAEKIEKIAAIAHWSIQIALLVVVVGGAMSIFTDVRRLISPGKRQPKPVLGTTL